LKNPELDLFDVTMLGNLKDHIAQDLTI